MGYFCQGGTLRDTESKLGGRKDAICAYTCSILRLLQIFNDRFAKLPAKVQRDKLREWLPTRTTEEAMATAPLRRALAETHFKMLTGFRPLDPEEWERHVWVRVPDDGTVMRELYEDVMKIGGLTELWPHISKHVTANFVFHLYHRRQVPNMTHYEGFAFYLTGGVAHWRGSHTHCRADLRKKHQMGILLPTADEEQKAIALHQALQKVVRQYHPSRGATKHPKKLEFASCWDVLEYQNGLTFGPYHGPH